MTSLTNVGNLRCLYLSKVDPGQGTTAAEYLIKAAAKQLNQKEARNWVPLIVRETGRDRYQAIGNFFIYAVAEEAGLERVWCIVADDSKEAEELTQILSGETVPKVNLSIASREEIALALQYLVEQPGTALKGIKLPIVINKLEEAPRQYWKSLNEVASLKCGITKGKKLDELNKIFYLSPQPLPDVINDPIVLNTLTSTELKKMAKQRNLTGYTKMKKPELVKLLSQNIAE